MWFQYTQYLGRYGLNNVAHKNGVYPIAIFMKYSSPHLICCEHVGDHHFGLYWYQGDGLKHQVTLVLEVVLEWLYTYIEQTEGDGLKRQVTLVLEVVLEWLYTYI